jgi:hypothetical protein
VGQSDEAQIRVYDVMAQGSSDGGLQAAIGRHLDLPVAELARLLEMLGADGLQAFCLYLEHLEQVPGVDGELTLGVPHFSARWLLSASVEAAGRTGNGSMSKNAATRGHQAVERSGPAACARESCNDRRAGRAGTNLAGGGAEKAVARPAGSRGCRLGGVTA